jgi:molecular chaperone DnaK
MTIDNELRPVLGIDLGTTFSAIARWNGRVPETYQIGNSYSLQSAVYYDPKEDEWLVGNLAFRKGSVCPENLVIGVKRLMDHATEPVTLGGQTFTPIELSAKILEKLYKEVASKLGDRAFESRGTVVTVPYYFKAHQCENTRKAAELANINCIKVLEEPIAASLAYAWQLVQDHPDREGTETILVFDLGGGTFDLTLFRLEQTKTRLGFEVLGTGGDDRLGGMDFDQALMALILQKSNLSIQDLPSLEKRKAELKILEQAIEAKHTLSATAIADVTVPFVLGADTHIDTRITREEFEAAIQPQIEKIEAVMQKLFAMVNLQPYKVDRVILVGGSSQIPCMKTLLEDLVGAGKVYNNANPWLSVAEGAALYAAYLDDGEVFGREIEIRTRTSHALGVEIEGGKFSTLIPANRKTPAIASQLYTLPQDDQTSLEIQVYQGSSALVKDNTLIGTLPISDLPKRKAGELDIKVTFKVSEEQRLSVVVEVEERRWATDLDFK